MTKGFWWYNRCIELKAVQAFIDKYGPIQSIYVIYKYPLAIVVSTEKITIGEAIDFYDKDKGIDGEKDWEDKI